jgi:hypothetical protein
MSPIYVSDKGGGTFTPHPEGQFAARCIDVVDVGWVKTDYGPKYKVRCVFFCGETDRKEIEGEEREFPLLVFTSFSATLSQRGKLRPFLESWRGCVFTGDELGRFDVESVLDAPAFLQIIHNQNGGRVYANVKTIMKMPPNMTAPALPVDFERVKDREGWTGPAPHPDRGTEAELSEGEPTEMTDYSQNDEDDGMPF